MSPDRNVERYRNQQVLSASPAQLVYMLYDRAIGALKEAAEAIAAGDVERRCNANRRALEIVGHMWQTLDRDQGGEIAGNLDQLFRFVTARLVDVDLRNDAAAATEVIGLLAPLRDSWRAISRSAAPGAPAAVAEPTEGRRTILSA